MINKNRTLFESLHNDYQPMVFQLCMGFMKGDKDVSQDLSQDVFINVWNALDRFKGESSYKTWIYRIAANTCLKYIRDTKSKSSISIDQVEHQLSDEPPVREENAHQSLYRAIGQLGEVDRLIIMMVLDELEYAEISNVMGITEANLRVKIHRIKKNLKTILQYD